MGMVVLREVVMIQDLKRQGMGISAIARHTGLDRKTVRRGRPQGDTHRRLPRRPQGDTHRGGRKGKAASGAGKG
ncbi:MAG: hypothetical protein OXK76_08550, partial [Gammaproteobacteria bacterium]|nr:hypothetical protein [Gammaproteobacteria bacterium]